MWAGEIENDGLNRLVLHVGPRPRATSWSLRTLCQYLRQAGRAFTEAYLADTLAANPTSARLHRRALPRAPRPRLSRAERATDVEGIVARARRRDRRGREPRRRPHPARALVELVRAAVRTNAYRGECVTSSMQVRPDRARVPARSRDPQHEIWVYSPRVEGVHLRGGDIARGGIRWSDRREDFRTEVLGLMKAQTVKNAVIVPVGREGRVRREAPPADAAELRPRCSSATATVRPRRCSRSPTTWSTARSCRRRASCATTATTRTSSSPPTRAPASFSDVANELAAEYGYWLGDAFASGGSSGYDHKEMGITSRGAWISVQAHFRAIDVDADTADAHRRRHRRHVGRRVRQRAAAFPAREAGGGVRPPARVPRSRSRSRRRASPSVRRLFALPASSWADYDPAVHLAGRRRVPA